MSSEHDWPGIIPGSYASFGMMVIDSEFGLFGIKLLRSIEQKRKQGYKEETGGRSDDKMETREANPSNHT